MGRLPDYAFEFSYGPQDDRLHDFYLPALERSVLYRRAAGFFSSSALAVAAAGVVRLIHNGGSMRLLCGAQLSENDVDAIRRGVALEGRVEAVMLRDLEERLADPAMEGRLEVMAWLVAEGRLQIRVVLRKGPDGRPLPASQCIDYYHPKEGVFEDAAGNKLAFSGSSNESATGWKNNYESFQVFTSWERKFGEQTVAGVPYYIAPVEHRFEELWEVGETDEWVALDIPRAARERLLTYRQATAPVRDPLEREPAAEPPEPVEAESDTERDRLIFHYLREAPYLPEASRLGVETSAVTPWPHQNRVIDEVVEKYPHSFLFCDEVGLGKTIEAGLAYRQLRISGRVERSLFLVPASVLRQWQEELWEKCALNVPRYERGKLLDVFDEEVVPLDGPPWDRVPHLLASSQLAKRKERHEEVLAAGPWDLVLVDEAHHARRKDFAEDRYRPNRLLELLGGTGRRTGLKDRTRCLYLLTATPMQVHPLEIWDLLRLAGMGGRWGALQANFLAFFNELRKSPSERDWDFLLDMLEDHLATGGTLDEDFAAVARQRLGPVDWDLVRNLPWTSRREPVIRELDRDARVVLAQLIQHHTPIRAFLWRNTRDLLRRYRQKGILSERVPDRDPRNEWIAMEPEEGDLYERIEEYISDFYQKYEAERKGLGFVMTVYRRRLTSSFHAVQRSLERRRDFLRGTADPMVGLTDEDVEQDELELDVSERLSESDRERFMAELEYVEDFLRELRLLATDSKLEFLKEQIGELFTQRDTIILFTQYTDTMDYLREELRGVYGSSVACYSGRGGEVWDGVAWVPRSKEDLKEEFRKGETVKLLLCTESASEGLNLQTCGVLINYDMPWNPMRVEQRIGRIDRIGQKYDEVWVRNYFYEETVEARVYQRLSDRIDWFEHVVGKLQPILHRVGRTIQELALLGRTEREERLDREVEEIRRQLDEQQTAALNLDEFVDTSLGATDEPAGPVGLQDLEEALTGSPTLGRFFARHSDIGGAYSLDWRGEERFVTFRPDVFDRHPYTVELLTYGNPLLDDLLGAAGEPPPSPDEHGVLQLRDREEALVTLFVGKDGDDVASLPSLSGYERAIDDSADRWTLRDREEAEKLLEEARRQVEGQVERIEAQRQEAQRRALLEEARQILVRSALIRRVLSDRMGLFEEGRPVGFATDLLGELAELGVPYRGLLSILEGDHPDVRSTDPFYLELQGKSEGVLRSKLEALKQKGMDVLRRYRELEERGETVSENHAEIHGMWLGIAAMKDRIDDR